MSIYQSVLLAHEEIANRTMAFHFQRPAGFIFKAGQAIDLILPNAPMVDAKHASHAFSLVSAPFEQTLVIATRMRDSTFKQALKMLTIGGQVEINGPFGSLTLHSDRLRPAIFIAGGIGITPFISMLRQASHDGLPRSLLLHYSNRHPADAAFFRELQNLEQQNANFQFLPTMTEMDASGKAWQGETGHINEAQVNKCAEGLNRPIFYVAGSPGMVAAVRELLNRIHIDDDDIRSEEFYGY